MALATVADLKSMLSIQHMDDDALLTRLVDAASDYFEKQTGRKILAADYVIEMDGLGPQIVPPEYPVITVTSVAINGNDIPASTGYGVEGWYLANDVIRLRGATSYFWDPFFSPVGFPAQQGAGNVKLAFRAGYETAPADVQQAVLEMAALMYRERDRVGQQSHNNASGSTVYYYAPPARVVSTIEAYRRAL